ncbi:MAG: right-handed parallel beta-helix repeat-containing protein [Planctomycetota bacterium]|jgi:hypothetical protein
MTTEHVTVGVDKGDVRGGDNRAIQTAVDALPPGGGTVELLEGEFTCIDAVHLRRGVRLVGQGEKTVLRRADGFRVPIRISADYAQLKITPVDISPFSEGRGLYVRDNGSDGWLDSVVTVERIEGGALHFREYLVMDYDEENGGEVIASGALISGIDVEDVAVEGLVVDGNRENNFPVGGCRSGGVYFHRSSRVTMRDLSVHNFNGDGISFQTTRDFVLERVSASHCAGNGVHPGTGSARVLMKDCCFTHNDQDGYYQCWRVQEGRFENVVCERNGRVGLNIGHKDTDNVFAGCVFRENVRAGVLFRTENANNGGHRNTFEGCLIENNGAAGIETEGYVHDAAFADCTIRETRGEGGKQRLGIVLGPETRRFTSNGCTWSGHSEGNVKDLTGGKGEHGLDA